MDDKLIYKAGEVKYATITVKAIENDEPFQIYDATWILYHGNEVVKKGECAVEGHELNVLVHTEEGQEGIFRLEYTYKVAAETLKKDVMIEVR